MYDKPMDLKSKLVDYVGANFQNALDNTEMFGVEIELEGAGGITFAPIEVMKLWAVHNDGSLRKMAPMDEAIEYVTKVPMDRVQITNAVKVITEFLNNPKIKVYDSYRTSVHVHVNCLADTMLHVYNFLTLCLLFDELFVSQNGDHRIGNNFCLRAKDAQGQIVELVKSIKAKGNIFNINGNNRYSSINFASLTKFGTVEFRSLECTTDPIRIMHWIRTIDFLKRASRTFTSPQDIIRAFSRMSSEEFVMSVLGPQASKYIKVLGYENMLFSGMRLAQEFAFCSKWIQSNSSDKPEPKNIKKPKVAFDVNWADQIAIMGAQGVPPNHLNVQYVGGALQYAGDVAVGEDAPDEPPYDEVYPEDDGDEDPDL